METFSGDGDEKMTSLSVKSDEDEKMTSLSLNSKSVRSGWTFTGTAAEMTVVSMKEGGLLVHRKICSVDR